MNPQDEINQLKKEIAALQATAAFQTAAFQVLYSLFVHSIASGEHGSAIAANIEEAYRLTLAQQIEARLTEISDDQPDIATELHKIFQTCLKGVPRRL